MSEGVDYSTDHPEPRGLASVGKTFACRYVGPGTSDKHLTLEEAQALADAGLSIVANAEGSEAGLLGGFGVGVDWALAGHSHAVACGMPENRPVYLSVDFDCTEAQWPQVAEALAGACEALGVQRVGVYGSIRVIEWARRDNVASWFWQSRAWSGDEVGAHADLYQYRNDVSLVGGTVDLDRALADDFGQWTPGGEPEETEDGMFISRDGNGTSFLIDGVDPTTGKPVRTYIDDPVALAEYERAGIRIVQIEEPLSDMHWVDNVALVDDEIEPPWVGTLEDAIKTMVAVDPVAVATAIVAHPEIARTLAEHVAGQLAAIKGHITLSGSLAAGIEPPTT